MTQLFFSVAYFSFISVVSLRSIFALAILAMTRCFCNTYIAMKRTHAQLMLSTCAEVLIAQFAIASQSIVGVLHLLHQ